VALFLLPDVEGSLADRHLPTDVGDRSSAFHLAQRIRDLLLRKLRLLHRSHSLCGARRSRHLTLVLNCRRFWGRRHPERSCGSRNSARRRLSACSRLQKAACQSPTFCGSTAAETIATLNTKFARCRRDRCTSWLGCPNGATLATPVPSREESADGDDERRSRLRGRSPWRGGGRRALHPNGPAVRREHVRIPVVRRFDTSAAREWATSSGEPEIEPERGDILETVAGIRRAEVEVRQ
jgi:hypothetical protein